jgi:carboxylesterase
VASVMKGAEPFGFDGGEHGVLLIHGYTGSPQGLRPWGEYLASEGFTVLCPRLPGHGTHVDDLHAVKAGEWIAEVEMSMRGLRERCETISVGALSMGGALALYLAENHPQEIASMALVNASVYSDDPRRVLAPLMGKVRLAMKGLGNDVADPAQTELCYPKISTSASAEVLRMMASVNADLEKVQAPTILFVSRQDHVVPIGNTQRIHDRISSTEKEIVWLEQSYHVATLDYDKEIIFERSAEFFRKHVTV